MEGGSPGPSRRERGEEEQPGDARHCPAFPAGTRRTQREAGQGKPILRFPSREIEAPCAYNEIFPPISWQLSNSRWQRAWENRSTPPPLRSHPRRLDRTGRTDTRASFCPPGMLPHLPASSKRSFSPSFPHPPARNIHISRGISVREFPPPAPVSPGLPPPAGAAAFIYFGIMRFLQLL